MLQSMGSQRIRYDLATEQQGDVVGFALDHFLMITMKIILWKKLLSGKRVIMAIIQIVK